MGNVLQKAIYRTREVCKEGKKFPYCTSLSLYFPLNGVVKFKYFLESIFISFFIVMNEPLVFLSQVLMKLRFKQKIKGLCLCGWVFSLIALPMALIILKEIKDDEMLMKVYKTSVHWNLKLAIVLNNNVVIIVRY